MLTALQFGYWAVLVYLPLFLTAAIHISMEGAGAALLAATLPMLLVPLIGGRLPMYWGWRALFTIAFGLLVIGDVCLVIAALSDGPGIRLAVAVAGMVLIGVGAALANPQLSGVVLALAPATQAGMANAARSTASSSIFSRRSSIPCCRTALTLEKRPESTSVLAKEC